MEDGTLVAVVMLIVLAFAWWLDIKDKQEIKRLRAIYKIHELLEEQLDYLRNKTALNRSDVIKLIAVATQPLDLRGVDLSGVDLSGLNLSGANLSYADLSNADLNNTDLSGADLTGADLTGANIKHAFDIDISGAEI